MRATLLLLIAFTTLGLFFWVNFDGLLFLIGVIFWILLIVITVGYQDAIVLFLLGAREVRSSDEKAFFEAASHEAYKLSLKMPQLYFYNGSLERAFVLQNRQVISIILNKTMLEKFTPSELKAICFELLIQVKKGMASKRTKMMFLLGFISWAAHSLISLGLVLVPVRNLRKSVDTLLSYFLHPALGVLFKITLGDSYFKKLSVALKSFPEEEEQLVKVGLKIQKPIYYHSLPSKKLLELASTYQSRHFQNIIALEFLPHEWDYFFENEDMNRAQ